MNPRAQTSIAPAWAASRSWASKDWRRSFASKFVPPGQGHTRHNHPSAEEIIFILKGHGEQMIEDENGIPETRVVGPGCTVFIPDSRFHATHNSGLDPMEIFVVYSPTGPEKMLQDAPDFRLIPANELTGD